MKKIRHPFIGSQVASVPLRSIDKIGLVRAAPFISKCTNRPGQAQLSFLFTTSASGIEYHTNIIPFCFHKPVL